MRETPESQRVPKKRKSLWVTGLFTGLREEAR